ncbi:MAG: ATP phosphoribosyltransferase [Ignavibacteria bacterium]|nr:ATP phosphoribosyltransferase [Ignavibacteria bacterium]
MNRPLVAALPKGRLFGHALHLFQRTGIRLRDDQGESRSLLFSDLDNRIEFVSLKPIDIPVYVETGSIDIGIVGSDILRELDANVYEPLDLRVGMCRLVLAAPTGAHISFADHLRIATKYPKTALRFFQERNSQAHIIRLDGSVEIAPRLGLADAIVDLVETGQTLRDNNMMIVTDVAQVSAKLIVNRTSMKIKTAQITPLISQLDAIVYENH